MNGRYTLYQHLLAATNSPSKSIAALVIIILTKRHL